MSKRQGEGGRRGPERPRSFSSPFFLSEFTLPAGFTESGEATEEPWYADSDKSTIPDIRNFQQHTARQAK